MSTLALVVGLAAFVAVLRLMRAADAGGTVLRVARSALATMSAPELTDDEKEARVRRFSGQMFRSFLAITGIAVVALAVPTALIWAGAAAGLYSIDRVVEVATGWPFLLAGSAGAVLLWAALERRA